MKASLQLKECISLWHKKKTLNNLILPPPPPDYSHPEIATEKNLWNKDVFMALSTPDRKRKMYSSEE